jgi:nicotinamidase-related amidase
MPNKKPNARNQKQDRLLTPENAAIVLIDYQPTQINSVNSMPRSELLRNITVVAGAAKAFGIPTIITTVNANRPSDDTVPVVKNAAPKTKSINRTTINSWEDPEFVRAIRATKRKKIIMCALWTEACLTFPSIDMLAEGFEIYMVVDAVGGTSWAAHKAALIRLEQAGAQPTTVAQLLCELQRDWARTKTVPDFLRLLYQGDIFLNTGKENAGIARVLLQPHHFHFSIIALPIFFIIPKQNRCN